MIRMQPHDLNVLARFFVQYMNQIAKLYLACGAESGAIIVKPHAWKTNCCLLLLASGAHIDFCRFDFGRCASTLVQLKHGDTRYFSSLASRFFMLNLSEDDQVLNLSNHRICETSPM